MALLALTLLTPYFKFIPKTTLAAILICAVLSLVGSFNLEQLCIIAKLFTTLRSTSASQNDFGKRTKSISLLGLDAFSFVSLLELKLVCYLASL
jgi:hypothetical protein